jgi:homogentisate 1,2-dioxygenase
MGILYILSYIVPEGVVWEIEFYDGADSGALNMTCKNINGKLTKPKMTKIGQKCH